MRDYLQGYLDVIPQSEKTKIRDSLKINQGLVTQTVSENEFAELVSKIVEDHNQFTEIVEQPERLSSSAYNQFFGNVQTDLDLMFTETNLIERALNSYERLYGGFIADLNTEINALRERVGNLKLVSKGENGLIVKSFDFATSAEMETDRNQFAHLFTDRDGTAIQDVVVIRNDDTSYLSLATVVNKDHIRDTSGNTIAKLEVVDVRGKAVAQNSYPIANAVDDSRESYWGEVVLSDEPINMALDTFTGGGAMVKFTVTLPRPEVVSQITLSPFTKYPLEIVSVRYEEDIETFHVPKELITKSTKSTQTMTLQFPSIIARRFTFVLRQENNVKNTYLVSDGEITRADLWDKISKRETEVSLGTPTNTDATVAQAELDVYSGWDIYQTELAKYEKQIALWTQQIVEYRKWVVLADTYKTQYETYKNSIINTNRSYGTSYTLEKNALE